MITIKLPYETNQESKDTILKYQMNQNNVIRFIYNRIKDNFELTQKDLTNLSNNMNNIFIDSWFKQSGIYKSKEIYSKNKDSKVIFGGKKLFLERINHNISIEEFQIKKLIPLISIGESSKSGNRKLELDIRENNQIIFKINRKRHIELKLPNLRKNIEEQLYKLEVLTKQKKISLTFQINQDFLYLTFDESKLNEVDNLYRPYPNRIMSLDINPNIDKILFPDLTQSIDNITPSLEELGYVLKNEIKDWKLFYQEIKNSGLRYRVSLNSNKQEFKVLRMKNKKSLVKLYSFY